MTTFASVVSGKEKCSISTCAPGARPLLPKQLIRFLRQSPSRERNRGSGLAWLRARFGQSHLCGQRRPGPGTKERLLLPDDQHRLPGKSRQQPTQISKGQCEAPLGRREIWLRAVEKDRAAARLAAGIDVVAED